ncbi:MAG: alpha-amylase family glycosyl hydrolase [Propionicimonas sp.]|uniref:pullulanase X25 domain-containing protein n=1 Tax=Propionicimonas sp. TaxID=1955623 RepID=UPI003D118E32
MRRPLLSLLVALTLTVGLFSAGSTPSARADTTSVTVAGSLQSELGCPADWQADCAATHLSQVAGTSTWQATFHVPAGSWEFKIAVNDSWDVNYGANGVAGGANVPLSLVAAADIVFSFDADSHRIGVQPAKLSGATTPADKALARNSLRQPLTDERYYFLMADRFANGDTTNDTGDLVGTRLQTGFDPTDKGFYHGGDLKGVINKLDYIKGLGTTAIWLTPSFKNKPVQGTAGNESAGYHGYWITDFTTIDPHLGTNDDMKKLIRAAHAKGMKVFFDIITNHTADVIDYSEKQYTYIPTSVKPYTDAAGNVFDPAAVANSSSFPTLDVNTSFPYHPVFDTPADATAKTPAWLNDPTLYHNRGDSTYAGESTEWGDFVGLDDLFTENPKVVDGMVDVYKAWVDLGIDGFRIDTVKHVDIPFWQEFVPAMQTEAKRIGNPDFFLFGEVYDARPSFMSTYTTTAKLPATLDFGFQAQAQAFALGKATTGLRDLYADDDYYTDADSNAYQLPTFLGNHDMGRIGYLLKNGGISDDADLMKRVQLADTLMYLTRGQPITYYGDEQGFIGAGGDKDAREDLFATKVDQYATEDVLGGASGSKDRYDTSAPLYRLIRKLAALREANPALEDGAQVHRYASAKAGIYAFSRVDRRTGVEYVVALNNAATAKTATFDTFNARARFSPVYGTSKALFTDRDSRITVTVPALSAVVYKANSRVDASWRPTAVTMTAPAPGGVVGGRAEISAELNTDTFAQASFWFRPVGTTKWQLLGTDDNAPYRVFHDVSGYPTGTLLEYRVVVKDAAGRVSAAASYGVVGTPEASGGDDGEVGPVTQPDAVSVPGDLNSEMGCGSDWDPACDQAQLTLSLSDQVWKGSYTLPAGSYSYKAAINRTWDENYGANAVKNGSNIPLTLDGSTVTFYYDHRTHYVTSDAEGPIITAPGSWNSELGCSADWAPDCMRPWLEDPDGDGTYTWASSELPVGKYEFKVAHDLAWDESYPAGNLTVEVTKAGLVVRVSYNITTHTVSTSVTRPTTEPSLDDVRGVWLSPDLIAWPSDALTVDPSRLDFRLAWGATGSLSVDAEDITGGDSAVLHYDKAGLPASVLTAHPELTGYLALRVDRDTSRLLPGLASGDVAVGAYSGGRLVDAGLVDTTAVK